MRLVIIRYDAADQVSLASGETFADADAVRAELVRLFRDGLLDPDGAYSLVDLDAASPLVVVAPAAPEEALAEPAEPVGAFFAPDLPEPPVAAAEELSDVAVAVEEPYASAVLEDLAPEDAGAGDAAQQWPWDLPGSDQADKEDAPSADDGEPVAEDGSAAEPEHELAVEPAGETAPEPEEEPVPLSAEEPEAPELEETALNDDLAAVAASLAEKMSEDALVSEPIRLGGDAGDGELDAVPVAVEVGESQPEEPGIAEPQGVIDAAADSAAMEAADDEPDRVYEPGALNMEEYTCDDCVYVNTCPNQHQKKPAECGSFQWKSV